MIVSKKSKYAMRAVFELSKHFENGTVKIADIAERQAIPPRFLEVILCQLKQGGFVDSKRGSEGGYYLLIDPKTLPVGKILRYFQGLDEPVDCIGENPKEKCALSENCVFIPLWEDLKNAISGVFDSTTFQDLKDREKKNCNNMASDYVI
jgi:Rrf2 family transcriptional regulator, cysteine metabolism repressor